jgi:hypothetical protein
MVKWRIVPDRQEAMKNAKFIDCDEDTQVFNWQRTYKKASHLPLTKFKK